VKDFCPNFPKLARKNSKEYDLQKNKLHFFSIIAFFKNQSTPQALFLPKFPLTCPKTAK